MAKKKILIVDDELQLLELMKMEFEEYEFEVALAENVDEAIPLLTSFRPNIVLSDLKMPGKSGKYLLDYIKDNHPKLKFIFMSGHAESDDPDLTEANYFLQKPFSLQTVVDEVLDVLK